MTMSKEPTTLIRSVIREIIDQKVYSLIDELHSNEFRDEVRGELYDHDVKWEDDYEFVEGDVVRMDIVYVQGLIDYLTDKYVSKIKVTNENW